VSEGKVLKREGVHRPKRLSMSILSMLNTFLYISLILSL
jgi:hypothetical protein